MKSGEKLGDSESLREHTRTERVGRFGALREVAKFALLSGGVAPLVTACGGSGGMPGAGGNMPGSGSMHGGSGSAPGANVPGATPAVPGGTRTFGYLGPDTAHVTAVSGMMMMQTRIAMANGAQIPVWALQSTADGNGFNGDRVSPGPVIELTEGQPAAITLNSSMPHTLHPHGLDVDTANDGVPQTSGFVAQTMMSPIQQPGQVGGNLGPSYTYRFTAPHAGTYMYHCHVDASLHVEMGMAGVVIVRPPDGSASRAWAGGPTFGKEYIWQLHTFDSAWHSQTATGAGSVRYRPDYFMINGKDGANTRNDRATAISAPAGTVILLRLVNIGYMPAVVSLGGINFDIVASDGRPLKRILQATSVMLGGGERYDLLFTLGAAGTREATVAYQSIRGDKVWGSATTTISAT